MPQLLGIFLMHLPGFQSKEIPMIKPEILLFSFCQKFLAFHSYEFHSYFYIQSCDSLIFYVFYLEDAIFLAFLMFIFFNSFQCTIFSLLFMLSMHFIYYLPCLKSPLFSQAIFFCLICFCLLVSDIHLWIR